MEGTGNQENPQAITLSQEQFQQFAQYLIQHIRQAPDNELTTMNQIMEGMTDNMISIDKDVTDLKEQLGQLRSGQISQGEIREASDEIFPIIDSEDTQKRIAKSVDQGLVDKFKNLSPAKKALAESGLIGAAGAITPIAIVGAAIAIPVALVALPLVLLYVGLKRAMPSKEEFKKTWQGISHDFKNVIDKVPTVQEKDSNIKKLFCDLNVTQGHKDFIKEYIVKNDGSKDQLKVDDNKIEAFKKAALTIGVNIDIKALSEKGKSTFDSDYEKFKTQITAIDKDVLESPEMKETFKDKLAEVKQPEELKKAIKEVEEETKKIDKAIGKSGSFMSLFSRSSSHTEGIKEEKNSNQGRST